MKQSALTRAAKAHKKLIMNPAKKTTPTHGGVREGAGRKRIAEGVESVVIPVRATPEQKAKFHALGGADWFRRTLDRAKLPKA